MVSTVNWVVLLGVAWFCMSLWVAHDASKNSKHSSFLWGLAVFVGGLLGLILYFILGREKTAESNLPKAESKTQSGLIKCPNCHALEDPARDVCRACEKPMAGT